MKGNNQPPNKKDGPKTADVLNILNSIDGFKYIDPKKNKNNSKIQKTVFPINFSSI